MMLQSREKENVKKKSREVEGPSPSPSSYLIVVSLLCTRHSTKCFMHTI